MEGGKEGGNKREWEGEGGIGVGRRKEEEGEEKGIREGEKERD